MTARPLISAMFMILVFAATTACRLEAQAPAEGSFERTLAVRGPVSLDIRTGSGSIRIQRGAADNIRVVGRIRAGWSWYAGDVEERIRRIEAAPPIAQDGGTIRIGRVQDDWLFRNVSISYDITVPPDMQVESYTGSGGIEVQDIGGSFVGRTGSGSITAEGMGGAVSARTGSGRVDVSQTGDGDVDVATGSGSIDVRGARRALRARAGSGSIELEGRPTQDWDVESGSGSIRIDFPADSGFELSARTGSGAINLTHPIALVDSRSRNRLRGTVRGGGSRVDLSTGSGSIQID